MHTQQFRPHDSSPTCDDSIYAGMYQHEHSPFLSPQLGVEPDNMELSLADKSNLGLSLCRDDCFNNSGSEHLQWELRKALERIHSSAGHARPIAGNTPAENTPFDGMDPVSSALLMELASSVMDTKTDVALNKVKFSKEQRKVAIKRWMEKRSRRHLVSQTKYSKMKRVAIGKNRCGGGKFVKKSDLEKIAKAQEELTAQEIQLSAETTAVKDPWFSDKTAWDKAYELHARPEE